MLDLLACTYPPSTCQGPIKHACMSFFIFQNMYSRGDLRARKKKRYSSRGHSNPKASCSAVFVSRGQAHILFRVLDQDIASSTASIKNTSVQYNTRHWLEPSSFKSWAPLLCTERSSKLTLNKWHPYLDTQFIMTPCLHQQTQKSNQHMSRVRPPTPRRSRWCLIHVETVEWNGMEHATVPRRLFKRAGPNEEGDE